MQSWGFNEEGFGNKKFQEGCIEFSLTDPIPSHLSLLRNSCANVGQNLQDQTR